MIEIDEALHNMVVSGYFTDSENVPYEGRFVRVRGQLVAKLDVLPNDISCGEALAGFGVDQDFKIGWDGKDYSLTPRLAHFLMQLPTDALVSGVQSALLQARPIFG